MKKHPLKGRKQSASHIAKRASAISLARELNPWLAGRPANTPEALWKKVLKKRPDECWEWLGYKNEQGYGRTWIRGKGYYAHRVMYCLARPGEITLEAPKDKAAMGYLRHTCDNPSCCNPNHLEVGTHQENMDDKVERGRSILWSTSETTPRAKLTSEDVFWLRLQKKYGATKKALALLYEVSEATISGACYGRHYQDVN